MSVANTTTSRITVRRITPALGAEVRGVDMREPLDAQTRQDILDAWTANLVLVFPGQKISDEEHVAFTRYFGEPEIFHQKIIKSQRTPEIFRVSNVDEDGKLMPTSNPTVLYQVRDGRNEVFNTFPEWLQEEITSSHEFQRAA